MTERAAHPVTHVIHLCEIAWRLYALRRWKALDRHREACRECWRKEAVTMETAHL